MEVRIFCASLAFAGGAALAAAAPPVAPPRVGVRIAGRRIVVPVPVGMTVGSPQLRSAEQSSAVPSAYRLVAVFEGKQPPAQTGGAYLVLVETPAADARLSEKAFAKTKVLARADVSALAARAAAHPGTGRTVPRVFIDETDAFAWLAPVGGDTAAGSAPAKIVAGTLFLRVRGRLLVLALRTEQAEPVASTWIEGETRELVAEIRKLNRD